MRSLVFGSLLFCLASANLAFAQSPNIQPSGTALLVHAGKLLDQPGKAPRGASSLLIVNGKIVALQSGYVDAASFAEAAGLSVKVLELREHFVLPGLIDAHVHLLSDKAGIAGQLADVTDSVPAGAYQAAVNARKTLHAGFTTVRNLGDGDGVTLALRDAIEAGSVPGPRILDAGQPISVTSGHMDGRLGFREDLHEAISAGRNLCDGADDCRKAVRTQIGRGVDVIKIATTGGVNSRVGAGIGQQMFQDEANAIVQTAHLARKKVAVHAHGADGIKVALLAGADSIEHGTLLDDETIAMMKKSGAYLVSTMSTVNGYKARLAADPNAYSKEVLAKIRWRIEVTGKSFRAAHAKGVNIAFGTDAGVSMHGSNADEFELMIEHGMQPSEAIVAATINAAKLLGVEQSVGTLSVGKHADLIAVRGDPLSDVKALKQVDWVIKSGVIEKSRESGTED